MAFDPEPACRIALGAIVASVAAIGIPYRLRADRAGGPVSRRDDPRWFWMLMGMVVPPVAGVCLAYLVQPRWVDFAHIRLPAGWQLTGVAWAIAGVALFTWMFRHLGLNITSTATPRAHAVLVTSGPYRWMRHPMYTAALILAAAATLLTANAIVAIGGVMMFGLLAARSRVEEQRLVEKFGDAYRDYQRRTGRFLPRVFS